MTEFTRFQCDDEHSQKPNTYTVNAERSELIRIAPACIQTVAKIASAWNRKHKNT